MSDKKIKTFCDFFTDTGLDNTLANIAHIEVKVADDSSEKRKPLKETEAFKALKDKKRHYSDDKYRLSKIPKSHRRRLLSLHQELNQLISARDSRTNDEAEKNRYMERIRTLLVRIREAVEEAEKASQKLQKAPKKSSGIASKMIRIGEVLELLIGVFGCIVDLIGSSAFPFLRSETISNVIMWSLIGVQFPLLWITFKIDTKDGSDDANSKPKKKKSRMPISLGVSAILFIAFIVSWRFYAVSIGVRFVGYFLLAAAMVCFVWSLPNKVLRLWTKREWKKTKETGRKEVNSKGEESSNSSKEWKTETEEKKYTMSAQVWKLIVSFVLVAAMIVIGVFAYLRLNKPVAKTFSDEQTGISVTATVPNGLDRYDVTVEKIEKETRDYEAIGAARSRNGTALTDETVDFVAYDIGFVKNKAVAQPDGVATVALPLPTEYAGFHTDNLAVYYVANGKTEQIPIKGISNGAVVFDTTHFSLYVLAVRPFEISFDAGGAAAIPTQRLFRGEYAEKPADPARTGYDFAGWTDSDGVAWDFNRAVTGDVSLTAKWTGKRYTVSFDPAGGEMISLTQTVTYGANYTLIQPTRTGFVFDGWYGADGNRVADGTWTTDGDVTLTAYWFDKLKAPKLLSIDGGTIEENEVFLWVAPGTESVLLAGKVSCSPESIWTLFEKDGGQDKEIETKVAANLKEGENRYYLVVADSENPRHNNSYELVIYRSYEVQVRYFDGERLLGDKTVTVQTGKPFVPDDGFDALGYDLDYWTLSDARFDSGVLWGAVDLYAAKTPKEEMSGFLFTSNATVCRITGVVDSAVTEIVVPDYVTEIAAGAFSGCASLESISIPFVGGSRKTESDTYQYPFGYIFGEDSYTGGTETVQNYYGDSIETSATSTYYIPSSLRTVAVTGGNILYGAFYNCADLTLISIPDSVASIGNQAFCRCSGLTSVTIPDSVTSIGNSAFFGCSGLTSVTIGNGVTSLDGLDFSYNPILTTVIIGNNVQTIPACAFSGCSGLTSVAIGNGVTSIGNSAFSGCAGLISVFWNATNCTSAGSSSYPIFSGCSHLTTVTFGDNVETIPADAFSGCTGLTSITIPNNITNIGSQAFNGCYRLIEVRNLSGLNITAGNGGNGYVGYYAKRVYANGESYLRQTDDGYLFYDDGTEVSLVAYLGTDTALSLPNTYTGKDYAINQYTFYYCSGLTSVTIGNGVTSIGEWAFRGCSGLTSVTIGNSVTSVGNSAFSYCFRVTSVTIPDSVRSIGGDAFRGCSGLTSVTIGNGVSSIGDNAFNNCFGLTSVVWNATKCDKAGSNNYPVFSGCSKLTSVTIGNNVRIIPAYAFSGCSGLTMITIGSGVISIGSEAFIGCNKLIEVHNLSKLTTYVGSSGNGYVGYYAKRVYVNGDSYLHQTDDGYLFYDDGTEIFLISYLGTNTVLTLPNAYTGKNYAIYQYAFCNCSALTSVAIGGNIQTIPAYAFSGCTKLTSVTISDSVESIEESAFFGCSGLTSITIPDSVTNIGQGVFSGCTSLRNIRIPFVGGSRKTANDTHQYPFGYIFGTSSYTGGAATNQTYYGSSTSTTTNTVYYIPSSLRSVIVTGGNILYGAFYNCSNLTSVTIPDSVISIGDSAFSGCSGLTSVIIPDSVTSVGNSAFSSCFRMTSVFWNATNCTLAGSLSYPIFFGCSNLTTVTIGNNVQTIPAYAFSGCSGLISVTIPDSVTSVGDRAFSNCARLTSVVWNATNCTHAASSVFVGSSNLKTVTIGSNVQTIPAYTFSGCSALTSVVWNATNCTLMGPIFSPSSNSNFTTVTISSNVQTIPAYAFSGCSALRSITIPNSVTSIGHEAFRNCIRLNSVTIPPSVTSIGDRAFSGCSGLTVLMIGNGVSSLPSGLLSGCSSLQTLTIPFVGESRKTGNDTDQYPLGYLFGTSNYSGGKPTTQTYYGSSTSTTTDTTYYIPTSLRSVTVTGGNILYGAFGNCDLVTVTIGNGVTSIGDSAFYNCYNLNTVTIGSGVTSIGNSAFYGCSNALRSITIPDNVTSIGDSAFYNCYNLNTVTIGSGVTSIGDSAFFDCRRLNPVTIPDNVTSIGGRAFYGCSGLTSVTIGSGVTNIGDSAFSGCSGLTSVNYTGGIAGWCGISFGSNDANPLYSAHKLYINNELVTELAIPNSVTSIGSYAFYGCTGLISVTTPNSVTSIESYAFYGCSDLTSVTIGSGVKKIGNYAFINCSGLTSVTFANKTGWRRTTASDYTGGTSVSVSNAAINATYLKTTYTNYYWYRQ